MAQLSVAVTLLLGLLIPRASARFGLPPRVQDYGVTTKEVDLVDGDGQKIHDILTSDRSCHLENETVIYSDGTTSTELTDHRAGVSLLQLSAEPDVCYAMDVSEEPKSCIKDRVASVDDENDPDAVVGYEAGEEINADELPPALRVRCHGRRVVALRRVNAKISAENEDERGLQRDEESPLLSRVARSCKKLRVKVKITFNCQCAKRLWGVCIWWKKCFRWEWKFKWVGC